MLHTSLLCLQMSCDAAAKPHFHACKCLETLVCTSTSSLANLAATGGGLLHYKSQMTQHSYWATFCARPILPVASSSRAQKRAFWVAQYLSTAWNNEQKERNNASNDSAPPDIISISRNFSTFLPLNIFEQHFSVQFVLNSCIIIPSINGTNLVWWNVKADFVKNLLKLNLLCSEVKCSCCCWKVSQH